MPFNGSGTFSIINSFVPNTTILSASVNQNFTDIATGLSDCLTRDNQAGMTAIFRAVSGSVSAPGITFSSDTTAGLFLSATGIVGLVAKSLGILVNSAIYQCSSAAVQAGGSGYVVGDTITVGGGTALSLTVLTVATLSGSAVATVTVGYSGNYTVTGANPLSQLATSGSGTGATFNLTYATQFTRSVVTNEANNALPWARFGASSFVTGLMTKANAYDYLVSLATFGSGFSTNKTTSPPTLTTTLNPSLVPNFIGGLIMSTAGSSGTMTIAGGTALDQSYTALMQLANAISKTTASWAVGTGNGGIDTGSIATNTWYHFYLIERVDTGVTDIIFSLSASAPTLPTNYTLYRRIGSGKTNGSSQWTKFTQTSGDFIWDTAVADTVSAGTSRTNFTVTVPTGVVVKVYGRAVLSAGGSNSVIITSLQESDQTPAGGTPNADMSQNVAGAVHLMNVERWTNTSAQIGARSTNAGTSVTVNTYGWFDPRGQ